MHGGKSMGQEAHRGASVSTAKWKDGFYVKEAVAERLRMRAMIAVRVKLMKALRARRTA
jgi:hypothetical protein